MRLKFLWVNFLWRGTFALALKPRFLLVSNSLKKSVFVSSCARWKRTLSHENRNRVSGGGGPVGGHFSSDSTTPIASLDHVLNGFLASVFCCTESRCEKPLFGWPKKIVIHVGFTAWADPITFDTWLKFRALWKVDPLSPCCKITGNVARMSVFSDLVVFEYLMCSKSKKQFEPSRPALINSVTRDAALFWPKFTAPVPFRHAWR